MPRADQPSRPFADRLSAGRNGLPQPNAWHSQVVHIPMRDGARLEADLYTPGVPSKGVILIRAPYGRGILMSMNSARALAGQGYTVLFVSTRGTAGSEGVFDPMRTESEDGHDVIDWMRDQPWYPGSFATFGHSYAGFTQWAVLDDQPQDMVASVVLEGPHDYSRHAWGSGSFHFDLFGWSEIVNTLLHSSVKDRIARIGGGKQKDSALQAVPVLPVADKVYGNSAPWLHERLIHPDLDDPFVAPMQHGDALQKSTVPTLIVAGWQDMFLDQSMEQFHALQSRGVPTRLLVGAWGHLDIDMSVALPATLNWLDAHVAGTDTARTGVDIEVTPTGTWQHLDQWPPADSEAYVLYPATGHALSDNAPEANEDAPKALTASFAYDPGSPTPSTGGNELTREGYVDDTRLSRRSDVLYFDSEPLERNLIVMGAPHVRLQHQTARPDADLFVRISDVDSRGRSRNVTEAFRRIRGEHDSVELDLLDTAHVFPTGHRIRLLIAGGWFPAFSRNPGTGENPLTARTLHRNEHTITLGDGTAVTLPVRNRPRA